VAFAGLVSTNAAAVALASLVAAGQISPIQGALPLAAALSANTAVRLWICVRASEPSYRWAVSGGLVLQLAALWAAWWLGGLILA
jgi:protein-S-isoprenylcysteine O-methyltransferase Ste14